MPLLCSSPPSQALRRNTGPLPFSVDGKPVIAATLRALPVGWADDAQPKPKSAFASTGCLLFTGRSRLAGRPGAAPVNLLMVYDAEPPAAAAEDRPRRSSSLKRAERTDSDGDDERDRRRSASVKRADRADAAAKGASMGARTSKQMSSLQAIYRCANPHVPCHGATCAE